MRRHVLLYGLVAGLFIAALQLVRYRWLVIERSVEIYGALIAALFAGLGIWLGLRLVRPRETVVEVSVPVPVPTPGPFVRDDDRVRALGLTPRELDILGLIAEGLSTREIAARAHVSENTVKTHAGRVFLKLGARRRTEAVQLGKKLRLIP